MIFVMCYPMVTAKAKLGIVKISAINITDEPNSQNVMYYGKSSKKRQLMTGQEKIAVVILIGSLILLCIYWSLFWQMFNCCGIGWGAIILVIILFGIFMWLMLHTSDYQNRRILALFDNIDKKVYNMQKKYLTESVDDRIDAINNIQQKYGVVEKDTPINASYLLLKEIEIMKNPLKIYDHTTKQYSEVKGIVSLNDYL